jgi:hypothetical protein
MIVAERIRLLLALIVLACPSAAFASDAVRITDTGELTTVDPEASPRPAPAAPTTGAGQRQKANFLEEAASPDARRVADWVTASDDNKDLPFIIVDKVSAKVFVFNKDGKLLGASRALLGKARGDDSVPGIGTRKLSTIQEEERTTPAGRFVATLGHDFQQDILWIDYPSSISLHRVITGNPGDHRLQRLASSSAQDRRISYGCINVPVKFYEDVVLDAFAGRTGIVYILPEIKTIEEIFQSFR